jgi:hypothetical protein
MLPGVSDEYSRVPHPARPADVISAAYGNCLPDIVQDPAGATETMA